MGSVIIKSAAEVEADQKASLRKALETAVQSHLDTKSGERGYDSILSLCSYATSKNPKRAAEGQVGVDWRDEVWTYSYTQLTRMNSGERTIPTKEELIAELPPLVWPTSS